MSAPITRATVTATSMNVMLIRLCPMRTKLGMAKAGIPSAGAKYDSTSQTTTNTRSETTVWRENVPTRPASRYSLRCIEDLVVGHLLIEAGFDGALHHVPDRLARVGLPRRLDDHGETLGVDRRLEDARRQLDGLVRDLVAGFGLVVHDVTPVVQGREQHLGRIRHALDQIGAHRRHDLPAILAGDLPPALRAVEDDLPGWILSRDDAGERLDDERRLDPVCLQLRARDREVGVDDGDILAEVDALGDGIYLDHLKLRSAHVGGELLAFEVSERLDLVVLGEDQQIGECERSAEDTQRHTLLVEFLQDGRPANQHFGLAGGETGVKSRDRRLRLRNASRLGLG